MLRQKLGIIRRKEQGSGFSGFKWIILFCQIWLSVGTLVCFSEFWVVCPNFCLFSTYLRIWKIFYLCKLILEIKCLNLGGSSNWFENTNIALGGQNSFHACFSVFLGEFKTPQSPFDNILIFSDQKKKTFWIFLWKYFV